MCQANTVMKLNSSGTDRGLHLQLSNQMTAFDKVYYISKLGCCMTKNKVGGAWDDQSKVLCVKLQ